MDRERGEGVEAKWPQELEMEQGPAAQDSPWATDGHNKTLRQYRTPLPLRRLEVLRQRCLEMLGE